MLAIKPTSYIRSGSGLGINNDWKNNLNFGLIMDSEIKDILQIFILPIALVVLGFVAKAIATNHEKRLSLNDKIIEKRVGVYESIGRDLNDIFSYVVRVGDWKSFTPLEILDKKRKVDKEMYVNRPYWSDEAFSAYTSLTTYIFEVYSGSGQDAKVRGEIQKFKALPNWDDNWDRYFSTNHVDSKEAWKRYRKLMSKLGSEFGFQN